MSKTTREAHMIIEEISHALADESDYYSYWVSKLQRLKLIIDTLENENE